MGGAQCFSIRSGSYRVAGNHQGQAKDSRMPLGCDSKNEEMSLPIVDKNILDSFRLRKCDSSACLRGHQAGRVPDKPAADRAEKIEVVGLAEKEGYANQA